ncbi:hypothetical protein WT60_19835 [Burkholderia sp. MSMB617WGS]|nr:hypothetical protein WS78_30030 [Burkholderia savannae]AOK49208.1 hypothetical protein WT60_19835 [Burkholderia sp. MSMB617WGS]KVG44866.1 hypothetical protein WS77_06720 [Burkholderia sp. MSMB0265]KVG79642.1 hypothetical protein WS81_14435 [Burkholderia sp. MSMB2040]KVG95991.1 hypothetical protein WS82_02130 [Burkholderia sp. MSMB2041]KVG97098.1 hypothetical protein WS83_32050 [Burkholderia sp. MSMB2042]
MRVDLASSAPMRLRSDRRGSSRRADRSAACRRTRRTKVRRHSRHGDARSPAHAIRPGCVVGLPALASHFTRSRLAGAGFADERCAGAPA